MLRMTDVVKSLVILNVIVFVATLIVPNLINYLALYYPAYNAPFRPYQFVSSFFTHGGLFHIAFNMIGLIFLGSALETLWGPQRFLIFYFVSALGASLFHFAMIYFGVTAPSPIVGASGAIYGLFVAFAMKFPDELLSFFFLPPVKAKYAVPIIISLDLVLGFSNFSGDRIAHFAHLGGALAGFILVTIWGGSNNRLQQW